MSDEKTQQEPSMEDILASIRRILSEDEVEETVDTPPPPPAPAPEPEPEEDVLELTNDMVIDDQPEPVFEPEPEPVFELGPEPEPGPAFSYEPEPEPMFEEPEPEEESLLAAPTRAASSSALAELTKAMTRNQHLPVGNGSLTVEALLREIMTPLLKEWLDNNLPQTVERLVQKEIERLVDRAEKN